MNLNFLYASSMDSLPLAKNSYAGSMDSLPLAIVTTILILLPFVVIILRHLTSINNIPPGPRPWPIIGNLPHMMGKNPHITITNFAHLHGPLISLRLGSQLVIVGSSPAAAKQILKTHDRMLSARYVPKSSVVQLRPFSIFMAAECNETWRSLRALYQNELFSARAIASQSRLREKKVAEMIGFISAKQGQVVEIGKIVFATVFNVLGNICFSKEFVDLEDNQELASGLKGKIWKMMELAATPNICDFYPIFDVFDPQGLRKKMEELFKEVFRVWDIVIKERRESNGIDSHKQHEDLLSVMLANEFSDTQINMLALELFGAGTDTTTATIEWAMAELLKNKESMNKVRQELKREISGTSVKETHMSNLPYVQACVKETLRLHPPGPFLIHRAIDTCEVMNFIIPKNSKVMVNLWALGRDPSVWEDPLLFKPERFVGSKMDFKGKDFELLPFGSGRRMCPGLPLGNKLIHLILASLIHQFEWRLPDNSDSSELEMKEKFGITMQKEQPLLLIPQLVCW